MIAIDLGDGLRALGIDDDTRADAWRMAIEQASSEAALAALEGRLFRRLELLRAREHSPHIERMALALIAQRREEIATEAMGAAAWP